MVPPSTKTQLPGTGSASLSAVRTLGAAISIDGRSASNPLDSPASARRAGEELAHLPCDEIRPFHHGDVTDLWQHNHAAPRERASGPPRRCGVDEPVVTAVDYQRRSGNPGRVPPQRARTTAHVLRDERPARI